MNGFTPSTIIQVYVVELLITIITLFIVCKLTFYTDKSIYRMLSKIRVAFVSIMAAGFVYGILSAAYSSKLTYTSDIITICIGFLAWITYIIETYYREIYGD